MNDCFKCSLAFNRHNIVYGDGEYPNQIMIIGEAPGYHEDKTGIPFCGISGKLLRNCLEEVGLDKVYITNIVKCRPYLNSNPKQEDIDICTKWFLAKELITVNPKFIITVGSIATNIYIKTHSISFLSGNIYPYKDKYILPLYHPSYIIRNGMEEIFKQHIKQIKQNIIQL